MDKDVKHTSGTKALGLIWLPRFLNKTAKAAERKRVLALLEKMRRFVAMRDQELKSPTSEPRDFGLGIVIIELTPEAKALEAEINGTLNRYRTKPVINGATVSGNGLWVRQQNVRHNYDPAREPWHVTESDAVLMLLNLADEGTLDLLKQCDWCKRWFKGKSNKTFCSVPCRRSHHRSSEEFKAHRRAYMRSNYRLHKERSQLKTATRKELQ